MTARLVLADVGAAVHNSGLGLPFPLTIEDEIPTRGDRDEVAGPRTHTAIDFASSQERHDFTAHSSATELNVVNAGPRSSANRRRVQNHRTHSRGHARRRLGSLTVSAARWYTGIVNFPR